MITDEQVAYVKSQLAGGVSLEMIKETLSQHGYTAEQIELLIATATVSVPSTSITAPSVPPFSTMLNVAFKQIFNPTLFLAFLGLFIAQNAITFIPLDEVESLGIQYSIALLIFVWGLIFVTFVFTIATIRHFYDSNQSLSVFRYISSSVSLVFPVLWVAILLGLVLVTGLTAFIIPGLVLFIYLMFAQSARIFDGVTGINALVRSTDMVRGHWWNITLILLGIFLIIFLISMVGGIVSGLLLGVIAAIAGFSEIILKFISSVFIQSIFSTIGTLLIISVIIQLYKALRTPLPIPYMPSKKLRVLYIVMAVLGPFATVAVLSTLIIASLSKYFY